MNHPNVKAMLIGSTLAGADSKPHEVMEVRGAKKSLDRHYDVYVRHFHKGNVPYETKRYLQKSVYVTVMVAVRRCPEGEIVEVKVGTARCNKKDAPNRKYGAALARSRLAYSVTGGHLQYLRDPIEVPHTGV